MFLLYNILSFFLFLLLLPILLFVISRKKYRDRVLRRLGFGLTSQLARLSRAPAPAPTFWIHALSVGEVTSALPLVRGIREAFPETRIVFSTTTRSGAQVAEQLLAPYTDALIPGPLDLGPIVRYFIRTIKPDLFILVETDFWPNWLHSLAQNETPRLLVNGRISQKSFAAYQRWRFFFRPMFQTFSILSMQTGSDAAKMRELGINADTIVTLGNLKFDTIQDGGSLTPDTTNRMTRGTYGFEATAPLWICGSTHRGEEEQIFQIFQQLLAAIPNLQLLIAPRNIERADEIVALGKQRNLPCRRWTKSEHTRGSVLILDTIGELTGCYPMADAVFIGGSLVPAGGHNPIEPASVGIPVLFGPHMEDFTEIAAQLVQGGGALQVESTEMLRAALQQLLTDSAAHKSMTEAALLCVNANRGVIGKHLETITALLSRTHVDG